MVSLGTGLESMGHVVQQPHAVLFPYPGQGHINPMMRFAWKLLADGFFVTFVNTDYNHHRMFSTNSSNNNNNNNSNSSNNNNNNSNSNNNNNNNNNNSNNNNSNSNNNNNNNNNNSNSNNDGDDDDNNYNNNHLLLNTPNLRFVHLPDGLPEGHGRFNENGIETTAAILALARPLTDLIKGLSQQPADHPVPPPQIITCIVADAFCSWVQDVADELGVPRVALWTTPAHANLAYHFQPLLIDRGFVPLDTANESKALSEVLVTCVRGVAPMKLHDYISFFLVGDGSDISFQWILHAFMRRASEAAWNLGNTWAELDAAAEAAFQSEVPNYLSIGPLLPDAVFVAPTTTTAATSAYDSSTLGSGENVGGTSAAATKAWPPALSLWEEDSGCLDWLSEHGERTVLYISFGSFLHMAAEELEALVEGIRKSGVPFLWALRPDDQGGIKVLDQLSSGTPELVAAGRLVAWAPQLAVLAHRAVGGFLTHCGWNSVLESIAAGVPMLARAGGFAEQRMNAHYVADVWKAGLRIHEGAGPDEVARLIRALMAPPDPSSVDGPNVRRRVAELRRSAAVAVGDGSSAGSYRRFVADMRRRA